MSVERADLCEECRARLVPGQRYCLGCGERIGARSPELAEVLRRVNDRFKAQDAAVDGAEHAPRSASPLRHASSEPPRQARMFAPISALRLPPARVSTLLVIVFLGFGVLLGGAASPHANSSLAASARPLKVVLPRAAAAAAAGPSASTPGSSSPASAPEAPEAETTPTPAASEGSTTAAKKPSRSAGGTAGASPAPTSGGGEGAASNPAPGSSSTKLPPVKHVFVIMLSDQPYAAVFGPASPAPYLSQTLEQRGELLVRYDAVAHQQLANEVALLSGQGPTVETAANCPNYTDIAPATPAADEQLLGNGCVYPAATETLAGQLTTKHLTWRAYVEGFDEAGTQTVACAHPVLGQPDPTSAPTASGADYATFSNPFVYFHSLIDSPACAANDVGLNRLKADLANARATPSFSYIAPDLCHDGNPTPCAPGAPAGLAPADSFLKTIVPEIVGSKAYKEAGLLVITVDDAPSSGEFADSSSCCGQPQYPNLAPPPAGRSPRGGGAVGALLLSPFVKGGTTSQEPFNHFSLLRTIEDLFGLKHLGYAALPAVKPFEPAMFTAAAAKR